MNVIPGYSGDTRTLDKLINGVNESVDDCNMWMVPWSEKGAFITIQVGGKVVNGIRFYNYNKSIDDASRGVKCITLYSEGGKQITPKKRIVLRKGSGRVGDSGITYIQLPY